MKRKKILLISLFLFSYSLYAQENLFKGEWKYSFTDSSDNALPGYNDEAWKSTDRKNLSWKQSDLNKNHVVWLRKKIIIPSSLKSELSKAGTFALYIGMLFQEDAAFMNGILIGKSDNIAGKRAYPIHPENILWDKENTVAVRIRYWWGDGCGLSDEPYLAPALLNTVFRMNSAKEGATSRMQPKNKKIHYTCSVKSMSYRTEHGIIEAGFYDFNKIKLGSIQRKITIKPGNNSFDFSYAVPSTFLKVVYKVTIPVYHYIGHWYDELGYNSIAYKPVAHRVPDKVPAHFSSPGLDQQVIEGWIGDKLKANKDKRLYNVDEESLLKGYINRPGTQVWIGEHAGKFLEAACNTYSNTHDAALKIQIDRVAQQLMASQLDNGYLGTYLSPAYWTSWDVWTHKYNIIGLLSYYRLSGFKPALAAAKKIGDLLCSTFGTGKRQLEIISAGEHMGMAATSVLDPMVDLYRVTGNKKYLNFCLYITQSYEQNNGSKIISTLSTIGRVDKTANSKAYEMLSNLVGLVKLYRVTANEKYLVPVLNAWKDIFANRLFITGTTSSYEHFMDNQSLPGSVKDEVGEGCVTTTWLQLNYQLLCLTGKMEYIDELERSVYNHLAGAENPQTGCVSYFTPLMGIKPYKCNITCCLSSIPRGIAMIPMFADGKINGAPSFLFYQPGVYKTTLNDKKKTGVAFHTVTSFPDNGNIEISVEPANTASFTVLLRKPYWADHFTVIVNGVQQETGSEEFVAVKRVWKKGDRINITFAMPVKLLDGGMSYPGFIAMQRGPQILVFDKSLNAAIIDGITLPASEYVPVKEDRNILPKGWIGTQAYSITAKVNGTRNNIIVVPYADAGQTGGEIETWIKRD